MNGLHVLTVIQLLPVRGFQPSKQQRLSPGYMVGVLISNVWALHEFETLVLHHTELTLLNAPLNLKEKTGCISSRFKWS